MNANPAFAASVVPALMLLVLARLKPFGSGIGFGCGIRLA